LQRDIADEEGAHAQTNHPVAESQVARHAERGVGQVGAVQIIDDVQDEKEWKQPRGDVVTRAVPNLNRRRRDRA
jgi:hypothetical protein